MDRISSLPEEMICHVGFFLSAKEAAFAMTLSKRWRNLFNIVQEFHFDDSDNNGETFKDFSDRVFALRVTSRVRKFSLKWRFADINPGHINRCLSRALKHGVVDLELEVTEGKEEEDRYSLPLEVFTCKTVAKLNLGSGFAIGCLPVDAYLPALKSLILHSVRFHEFDSLLSGCPVLEELEIHDFRKWKWSHTVSSSTLKRLTFDRGFDDEESVYESISFDTPALTYLNYSDFTRKEYPIVNLNSLVESKLDIYKVQGTLTDPKNLFNGLKNVEILTLTEETLDMIHDVGGETFPVFENLSHLTLRSINYRCWFGLQILLQKSPKLKTLTLDGYLHSNVEDGRCKTPCECLLGYSFLLTCPIEVLTLTRFEGGNVDRLHLKHILENLPCLKVLRLGGFAYDNDEEMKIKKDLSLMLPKGSSKCKIQTLTKLGFCFNSMV